MLQLYIGNKNYSTWSMRPWVLMRQAGIDFKEVMVPFDSFEAGSQFKTTIARLSPVGRVPVLVDGGLAVWDSLAIAEYLAERFPGRFLWPADPAARARARSLCAEMHAGFQALRSLCPMNVEASLPEVGRRLWSEHEALREDVDRLVTLWRAQLAHQPEDGLLFGAFSIADAFYAPVCMRLATYALPLPDDAAAYAARVRQLPAVRAWIEDALAERSFLPFEEPYRQAPDWR